MRGSSIKHFYSEIYFKILLVLRTATSRELQYPKANNFPLHMVLWNVQIKTIFIGNYQRISF